VRGCLADAVALGDLGAAQALVLVQVAQLLTAGLGYRDQRLVGRCRRYSATV
jgi:hypothetical protein